MTLHELLDEFNALANENLTPYPVWYQQVWVLEGAIDVTLGAERHRLREGDCLALQLDCPTMFHNPTRKPTRYAVVIASAAPSRR